MSATQVAKIDRTELLIFLQICVLRICGLWPKWRKPFRDCVFASVGIIIYTALIWIISVVICFCAIVYWPYKFGLKKTFFIMSMRTFFEVLVRVSIIHLGVSNTNAIYSIIAKHNKGNKRHFLLFLLTSILVLVISLVTSLYPVFASFESAVMSFRGSLMTGSEVELYLLVVSAIVNALFQVPLLPTCLLLSVSCSIANNFKKLKNKLALFEDHEQIRTMKEDPLIVVKQKFYELCSLTSEVDTIFKHYVGTLTVSIGVTSFCAIYLNNTNGCGEVYTLTLTLLSVFLGVLILCVSGDVITSAVSTTFEYFDKTGPT